MCVCIYMLSWVKHAYIKRRGSIKHKRGHMIVIVERSYMLNNWNDAYLKKKKHIFKSYNNTGMCEITCLDIIVQVFESPPRRRLYKRDLELTISCPYI